ncbi:unnamed protein product (macronuclear) [Paramecium tetraurelia]|uniref:Ubiquitin-like domain-containing protein n=1 Tax=Paramecium tetraurelia TaxID=5888 RepID=A0CD99_PARTE|nr:uncharacterized protein GSPATT00006977001 [Paramecium tetraurelia]CAK68766.1 unnamed protein product [Paramecium tetraurelia]|eukprot:XP_001436163.1 hypothetical protein (macronuclear) [Paramecium tetraurelia strain d4-2]
MNICQCSDKPQNKFTIIVENHENDRDYIEVELKQTISDVKRRVFKNVDPAKSQLYFKRTKLLNNRTIQDCGLTKDSIVYIIYGDNISE